ncbi:DUF58 domain-containing protein [Allobranchiibius huperziae]|uniref:Uncharacterized protein (DUF58 family) n=1 Tax=Allobranchiibius huperziae TaxID=1874116 RepID=A0A853DF18_9MICO|nr:uncharacterized protein (DUF58 family) [Allobranchiibius huperziae]
MNGWRPTPALLTAAAATAGLLVIAVLSQNSGLVVVAAPLLIISVWSLLDRPEGRPRVIDATTVPRTHEGATQTWSLQVTDLAGAEIVDATTSCTAHVDTDPASGLLRAVPSGESAELSMRWAARRWGPAEVGSGSCVAFSTWSGFRAGPLPFRPSRVQVSPAIPAFTATGGAPRPAGLVGQNRSQRRGDGSEFADIRGFQSGDRLRRIHWPISARTGQLHVRTTYAELDSEILLVLDAEEEYGDSSTHAETSLDIGVRSCAAMAAHLLQRGERVGLQVLSSVRPERVRSRGGSGQLRRILHELSGVRPGALGAGMGARNRIRASRGTLVVVVTPLVGTAATTLAAEAAQRGLPTVLVDSLPAVTASGDPAQRLSMLQRQVRIQRLQAHGLAVVPWRGPGSLDPVLRRMGAAGVGGRVR